MPWLQIRGFHSPALLRYDLLDSYLNSSKYMNCPGAATAKLDARVNPS